MSANGDGSAAPNIFGLTQYDGATQFFGGAVSNDVLSQGVGWAIIIGFSAVFFLIAAFLVWVDKKFAGAKYNNEQFNTAGRTIGAGLIAVDVVSHWTWASIILSTGTYVWFYGAGSAMWYGTGSGTMTVWLFCVVAIELKHRAPRAHTFLELIKIRWGTQCHLIFMFFAIFTNFFVCLGMMQSAVVVINAVTSVNIYASSFVLPLGVAAYAITGGLKATFTTSYLHTILIYVAGAVYMFYTFTNKSTGLGSIDVVYDRLVELAKAYPVSGNKGGSYLTAYSDGLLQINIINVIIAFAVLFVDQSYWQSAVAASPAGAVNGYAIGSFLYLGIVFVLPIGLGLGGLALDLPLSVDEVYNQLVLPACSYALMGKSGLVLLACVVMMAITSGAAGEMLAVSSVFTFDVWRMYVRPKAQGPELVMVSRIAVFVWAVIMGGSLSILNAANVNVYWLTIWIAVVASGAVGPVVYLVAWDRCTAFAAGYGGAVLGCIAGVITWLVYPQAYYGSISIFTTEQNGPVLAGSGACLAVGIFVPPIITWLTTKKSDRFDWKVFDTIEFTDDESTGIKDEDREFIAKWRKPIWAGAVIVFVVCEIVWPLLTLPAGVWSRGYFRFTVILAFIICILSSAVAIFLPAWEGRWEFYDLVNWCLRHDIMPTGPKVKAIPDGIPPPDADMKVGKGDLEMAKATPTADDTAHGGNAMSALKA